MHEKIQNFMTPIDAGGWHDEQVDELFSSLLGRSTAAPAKDNDTSAQGAGDAGAGFRIFG